MRKAHGLISCLAAACLLVGQVIAQSQPTSRPVVFPAETADAMLRLRDGKGSVDDLKSVFASETAAGRFDAATWWIEVFETSSGGPKIAGAPKLAVAELRRTVAKQRVVAPELKDLLAKHLIRVNALMVRKNFDAARRTHAACLALQLLVDDPATMRTITMYKERLEKSPKGDEDTKDLERSSAAFATSEDAAIAAFKSGCQDLFAQYQTSGCNPGRLRITAGLEAAELGGLLSSEDVYARLVELRAFARRVERTKRLAVLLRVQGTASYFLDGSPIAPIGSDRTIHNGTEADRIEFDLLPSDMLHVKLDMLYSGDVETLQIATLHATLDTVVTPRTMWKRNLSGDGTIAKPKLGASPTLTKRPRTDDDIRDASVDFAKAITKHPFVLEGTFGASGVLFLPFDEEFTAFEKTFADRSLEPLWFGAMTKKFVLTFVTPK